MILRWTVQIYFVSLEGKAFNLAVMGNGGRLVVYALRQRQKDT